MIWYIWHYSVKSITIHLYSASWQHTCLKALASEGKFHYSRKQSGIKCTLTFPVLWRMVVLVLQTRSLLTISLVTSTSASTKLLCFSVMSSSRSVLIVERFLAIIFALMAAIFSTDMASDSDLEDMNKRFDKLNYLLGGTGHQNKEKLKTRSYLICSICTMPSLWPSRRAARRSLSRRTRSSSLRLKAVFTLLANCRIKNYIISKTFNCPHCWNL